ncbi:hypothetical protein AKO1_015655 [Acrasis kona]|uniref:Uncharacterized protein n=1 Tax=Acrasis kona TaxID=1008807 RepID=A0AAW2ZG33_9EUKA
MEIQEREVLTIAYSALALIEETQRKMVKVVAVEMTNNRLRLQFFYDNIQKSINAYHQHTPNKNSYYRYTIFLNHPPQTADEFRSKVLMDHKDSSNCSQCLTTVKLKIKHTCRFCNGTTCNSRHCFLMIPFNKIHLNPRYHMITYKILVCIKCATGITIDWPQAVKMLDTIEDYVETINKEIKKMLSQSQTN